MRPRTSAASYDPIRYPPPPPIYTAPKPPPCYTPEGSLYPREDSVAGDARALVYPELDIPISQLRETIV